MSSNLLVDPINTIIYAWVSPTLCSVVACLVRHRNTYVRLYAKLFRLLLHCECVQPLIPSKCNILHNTVEMY